MRPFRFRIPFLKSTLFAHAFQRLSQPPRKPRHRALRVLLGVLGLAVLALMVAFGLFLGLAMLGIGALLRLSTLRGKAPARKDAALSADFRVVRKPALPAR
jgi:hypothetical protein